MDNYHDQISRLCIQGDMIKDLSQSKFIDLSKQLKAEAKQLCAKEYSGKLLFKQTLLIVVKIEVLLLFYVETFSLH